MDVEELWDVVRSIPKGRVASYGDVGQALRNPTSGRIIGRRMAHCPSDVPWWRVVDRNGCFPVGKLDPLLEKEQAELLKEEGVELCDLAVPMDLYRCEPDELAVLVRDP